MPVQVQVHSTPKRAILVIGVALLISLALVGLKKLSGTTDSAGSDPVSDAAVFQLSYIAPAIYLNIPDDAQELVWSAALARTLDGQTEVVVQNGRVDVLTDLYAIEVERLAKWHEGIGQSLHYSIETSRIPCMAIILDAKDMQITSATLDKLFLIEKTALDSGIKLLFLVSSAQEP
jgi:hypothetical protein